MFYTLKYCYRVTLYNIINKTSNNISFCFFIYTHFLHVIKNILELEEKCCMVLKKQVRLKTKKKKM